MPDSGWASGLYVSRWAKQLWYEAAKEIYFSRFMGEGPNFMISTKNELAAQKGDDITVGLVTNLSGDGVTNDDMLEGNEEKMNTYDMNITINQKRNAVRNEGDFDDKRVLYSFRKEAKELLKIWLAEHIDSAMFTVLGASPTRTYRADNGGDSVNTRLNEATTATNLVAADVSTPADISAMKTAAMKPKGANELKIRPIRYEGKNHYILLITPEQGYDLKRNSEWLQAQREANVRGRKNPIFTGAFGMFDDVIIHTHENVTVSAEYGSGSVYGAQALFMGAQAGVFASGGRPQWVEKKFDYGNKLGIAGGRIYGVKKSIFNSEDFGIIAYYTACSQFVG